MPTSTPKRRGTEAAYTAKIIRAELKDRFPNTKFRVVSDTYSMGDSVDVTYERSATAPDLKEVEAVVKKYQAGHFDGMTDCYEYSNRTTGPTVKWVSVNRTWPQVVIDAVNARVPRGAWPEEYRRAYEEEFTRLIATTI